MLVLALVSAFLAPSQDEGANSPFDHPGAIGCGGIRQGQSLLSGRTVKDRDAGLREGERAALDRGLRWLVDLQEGEGRWDDGAGDAVELTALSMLALRAADVSLTGGGHKESFRDGLLGFLGDTPLERGQRPLDLGPVTGAGYAMGTLALAECLNADKSVLVKRYVKRALEPLGAMATSWSLDDEALPWALLAFEEGNRMFEGRWLEARDHVLKAASHAALAEWRSAGAAGPAAVACALCYLVADGPDSERARTTVARVAASIGAAGPPRWTSEPSTAFFLSVVGDCGLPEAEPVRRWSHRERDALLEAQRGDGSWGGAGPFARLEPTLRALLVISAGRLVAPAVLHAQEAEAKGESAAAPGADR